MQDGDARLTYCSDSRFSGIPDSRDAADRYMRDGDSSLAAPSYSSSGPSGMSKEDWNKAITCLGAKVVIDALDLDLGGKLINTAIQGSFCNFDTSTNIRGYFDPIAFGHSIQTLTSLPPLDLGSISTPIPQSTSRVSSVYSYSEAASIIALYGSGSISRLQSGSLDSGVSYNQSSHDSDPSMARITNAISAYKSAYNVVDREIAYCNLIAIGDQEKTLRKKEAAQLQTLLLNIENASIYLANNPKEVAVQICNLKALSKLLKEFADKAFSAHYQGFLTKATTDMGKININLLNKLNAFETIEKELRNKEVTQLSTLLLNADNAADYLINHPKDVVIQLDNLKTLIKLYNDFSVKPFSDNHKVFLLKSHIDLINLNVKLHNKLNGFINLHHQGDSVSYYMQHFSLPKAKRDLGGQTPAHLEICTYPMALHWQAIYCIAEANANAAVSHFKSLHRQDHLSIEYVRGYIKTLNPESSDTFIDPIYYVLIANK